MVLATYAAGARVLRRTAAIAGISLLLVTLTVAGAMLIEDNPYKNKFFRERDRLLSSFDMARGKGVATRLFVWKRALKRAAQRPLIGYGPDTHVVLMGTFNREYIQSFNEKVIIDRAHNNYIDILLAQGMVGLAAYLSVLITLFIVMIKSMRRASRRSHKIIYCGFISLFLGYCINDFFIFSVVSVSPTFWSLMGVACALGRVSGENRHTNKQP
jgi:O-antigen ligase